jgi:hypothetical protein
MPAFSPADSRDDEQQIDASWLTDVDRPSFGERIGARAPQLQPIPPNRPAPEDRQPAPQATIELDPSKMPDIMKGVSNQMPPQAPVGSNNPNLPGLLKQQAEYGKPIDRAAVDPKTGKPMYRMGTGMRVLGTVGNFLSGFGGRGPTTYVGPGATNARYDIDEATRQANLANVNTQIKGQEQLDTENIKQEREATRQAYETMTGEARKTTADAQQSRADAYQQLADTRQQLADLQAGKSSKVTQDANDRSSLADQMGLKGNERRDYILTGKLPKDFSGRQPTELETWMQAFRRDNGRPPTADEIAMRKARTRGTPAQFSKVEADKKSGLMKAEKQYREDKLAGDPDAEKNLNLAKQLAQESYEQQIQTLGGSAGGRNQDARSAARSTTGAPSPATHTFSQSAWKKANPNGNVDAAKTAAQNAGYRVVQ